MNGMLPGNGILNLGRKSKKEDEPKFVVAKRLTDAVWCSKMCSDYAATLGFEERALWSISISVSELVTNAVKFAGGGRVFFKQVNEPAYGIEITVEDDGPGCENIGAATEDGFSEGRYFAECEAVTERNGLGSGLGAVKRLMDKTEFENRYQAGFRATITKFLLTDH